MLQFLLKNYDIVAVASLLTLILSLLLRPLAIKISLVDRPDERKFHRFNTPLTGGVAIFSASIITLLIFDKTLAGESITLIVYTGLMLILGLVDDQFNLPANTKLFGQVLIAVIFIISDDSVITNLGTPLGFSGPLELGLLSIPFTVVAIVGLTNAINMIDGCDGFASSIIIISLLATAIFSDPDAVGGEIFILLIVLPSLVVFLFFNFSNSRNIKAFLGDGGSLFLGFLVAITLVDFAESNTTYDPSIVLWFAAVPIFDFCTVVVRRALLKRKITAADRSHIHHYILSFGFSHFQATLLLSVTATTLLLFGIFVTTHYPSFSFFSFLMLFVLYLSFRMFAVKAN